MTAIRNLNANFEEKATLLEEVAGKESLMQDAAQRLLARFEADYTNAGDLCQLLHEMQRFQYIHAAGGEHNLEVLEIALEAAGDWWQDAPELPIEDELQERVGDRFLDAPLTKPGANVLISTQAYGTKITERVVEGYVERGENFDVAIADGELLARLVNAVPHREARAIGEVLTWRTERTEKILPIMADTGEITTPMDPQKAKVIGAMREPFNDRGRSVDNYFTLTRIPTPRDAEIDGMDYEAYLRLFFELCDQPWDEVTKAQEKLIEKFDAATELHITNDDGTDLTLNIEGQTFANSVVKKNIPGSEIFSAPKIDGVNGTLVSKGRFKYGGSGVMEDITLRFENGRVVEAHAEKGNEGLQKVLATDEGARGVGEIGIGTNPWLDRHVMNTLLVEKIGGSFHVALGACYDYDEYDGHPVNVKNGNQSEIHWDLTTLLRGRGGRMFLDGELIQQDGDFIGEEYEIFNKGWAALPEDQIPEYWKQRLVERPVERAVEESIDQSDKVAAILESRRAKIQSQRWQATIAEEEELEEVLAARR